MYTLLKCRANNRGFALIVTSLLMVSAMILSAAFFSRSTNEKHLADVEKLTMQADFLAESGANHGLSELRKRIETDLVNNISTITMSSFISTYYTTNDPLGFLQQYAYQSPDPQFNISGGEATLTLSPLNTVTNIQGNYGSIIRIASAGAPQNPGNDYYKFFYRYTITGTGYSTAITPNITKNISLTGTFTVAVRRDNFAKYALFTDRHTSPSGQAVWFTERTYFYGPVHTNDRFSFANNPSGHFTDVVTQTAQTARFYNHGSQRLLDSDHNGTRDVPTFDVSFTRGVDLVNLQSSLTSSDLKAEALGTLPEPTSSGIYVPNQGGAVTGGIYIRGDANLTMGVDADNDVQYTITQGSTQKIISVDYPMNSTTVHTVGGSTEHYTGLPKGVDHEGVIIYGRGSINNVSGIVQRNTNMTISAEQNINISGNIRYQDYNAGTPPDAIGYANMLGIIAWNGNVVITQAAPNNVEIHGIVMAPNGIFTVDRYDQGSPRGTATLLGGAITDYYGAFGTFNGTNQVSGYGRNFIYDNRVLSGTTPPYFPYMVNFAAYPAGLQDRPLWKKGN